MRLKNFLLVALIMTALISFTGCSMFVPTTVEVSNNSGAPVTVKVYEGTPPIGEEATLFSEKTIPDGGTASLNVDAPALNPTYDIRIEAEGDYHVSSENISIEVHTSLPRQLAANRGKLIITSATKTITHFAASFNSPTLWEIADAPLNPQITPGTTGTLTLIPGSYNCGYKYDTTYSWPTSDPDFIITAGEDTTFPIN